MFSTRGFAKTDYSDTLLETQRRYVGRIELLSRVFGTSTTRPRDFTHSGWVARRIRHDDRTPGIRGQSERRPNLRRPLPRRVWSIPSGCRRPRTTQDGWFRTGAGSVRALSRAR